MARRPHDIVTYPHKKTTFPLLTTKANLTGARVRLEVGDHDSGGVTGDDQVGRLAASCGSGEHWVRRLKFILACAVVAFAGND